MAFDFKATFTRAVHTTVLKKVFALCDQSHGNLSTEPIL